ncbi:NADPH-dependent FMN reductase [Chelatococcus sp. GCM10030263]|uniref:NADPH-dependent FMN reductase n=1 Tax=Chelatococcus sp. GCM10030263 TaxID=3273387 RepID=UPI0036083DE4
MLEPEGAAIGDQAQSARHRRVLVISGSPTIPSKTALLADMVAARLCGEQTCVEHLRLLDLPAEDLVAMKVDRGPVAQAIAAVSRADGLVIATPTFKASFSGLTKLFLDLLPQFGLAGKAVLPLATGGSLAHVLALDYSLRPVLQCMGARCVVPSFYVTADAFTGDERGLSHKFEAGLADVLSAFREALGLPAKLEA